MAIVTGAGTGTWEFFAEHEGVTEIQPGSFVLMDCEYHAIRPEYGCAQSILAMVLSVKPRFYVLDAGSKAISNDFAMPIVKGRPEEKIVKLAEEHAKVECTPMPAKVGDLRQVISGHCCATMNLHRQCLGVRQGKVETVWPIEAKLDAMTENVRDFSGKGPAMIHPHRIRLCSFIPSVLLGCALVAAASDPARSVLSGDKARLLILKDDQGKDHPIKTAEDWSKRRAHILANMEEVMGPLPGAAAKVPLDVRYGEEKVFPTFVRQKAHVRRGQG